MVRFTPVQSALSLWTRVALSHFSPFHSSDRHLCLSTSVHSAALPWAPAWSPSPEPRSSEEGFLIQSRRFTRLYKTLTVNLSWVAQGLFPSSPAMYLWKQQWMKYFTEALIVSRSDVGTGLSPFLKQSNFSGVPQVYVIDRKSFTAQNDTKLL